MRRRRGRGVVDVHWFSPADLTDGELGPRDLVQGIDNGEPSDRRVSLSFFSCTPLENDIQVVERVYIYRRERRSRRGQPAWT